MKRGDVLTASQARVLRYLLGQGEWWISVEHPEQLRRLGVDDVRAVIELVDAGLVERWRRAPDFVRITRAGALLVPPACPPGLPE